MRYGVIDLGTNTFHLLIVEHLGDKKFKEVYRKRFFIHLAENGIEIIGKAPFERGIAALKEFRVTLDDYEVVETTVLGTAALRTASNGELFQNVVRTETGIYIQIIDGSEEAKLIYYGVRQAIPLTEEPVILMDIGGGSVEFIIANKEKIFWEQSFPIGVAVLYKRFQHKEPMPKEEIETLTQFLATTLAPLVTALQTYPSNILIGASGTFDVLENIITITEQFENGSYIEIKELKPLIEKVVASNLEERYSMKEVPNSRAVLIVVALILVEFIIKKLKISKLGISNYAMKEGILWKMMN